RGYEPPPPPEELRTEPRRFPLAEREAPALPYNAIVTREDKVLPVYPANRTRTAAVAFSLSNGVLTAKDPPRELWSVNVGEGTLFGGFDFNRDGWTDVGLVRSRETGDRWGSQVVKETWIDLVDGRTGKLYSRITAPARDKTWDFRTPGDRDPK